MEPTIVVQNILATASAGCKLNLAEVARMDRAKYNPKVFPAVVVKIDKPKASVLVFASGKMVCTGTQSPEMAAAVVRLAAGILHSRGLGADPNPNTAIRNIVATVDMGRPIKLEQAALALPRAMYELEIFPGVVYRVTDPKVTMLLYGSGKTICTGAKSMDDIRRVSYDVHRTLESGGLFKLDAGHDRHALTAHERHDNHG